MQVTSASGPRILTNDKYTCFILITDANVKNTHTRESSTPVKTNVRSGDYGNTSMRARENHAVVLSNLEMY